MKFEGLPILKPAQRPSLAFMKQYVRVTFLEEAPVTSPTYENLTEGQTLVDQRGERWLITDIKKEGVPGRWAYTIKSKTADFTYTRPLGEIERYYKIEQPIITKKRKTIWAQKLKPYNRDILYRIVAGGEIDKLITIAPENILEEIPAIENAKDDIYWWTVDELRAECARQGLPTEGHKKLLIELLAPGKGINPPYPIKAGQVWDPIRHIWTE